MKNRIKLSKNFYLDEFYPKDIYLNTPIWKLLRPVNYTLINAMQVIRDRHGARTVNNWWHGRDRDQSGMRFPGQSYYKQFASHSFFNASDSVGITPVQEIWEDIEKNYNTIYKPLGVTAIEKGRSITWLHLDVGNFEGLKFYKKGELYIINI